jgi:hypothetical protein
VIADQRSSAAPESLGLTSNVISVAWPANGPAGRQGWAPILDRTQRRDSLRAIKLSNLECET